MFSSTLSSFSANSLLSTRGLPSTAWMSTFNSLLRSASVVVPVGKRKVLLERWRRDRLMGVGFCHGAIFFG